MELRLSHSLVDSFRKCPYYYKLHYVNKVRKRERPTYFAFGTAVHEGIRAWYQGLPWEFEEDGKKIHLVDKVYANEIDLSRLDAQRLDRVNVEKAKVKGILDGYKAHYATDPEQFQKIITERDSTAPVPVENGHFKDTPYTRAVIFGYLDCLVQDKNGDWWIKETKTTGDDIDDFIEQAKWNAQLCTYMVLAKEVLGVWPRGVLFDVIVKTTIKQRTARKPETLSQFQRRCYKLYAEEGGSRRLFVREPIPFNARDIKVWKREIVLAAEDLLRAVRLKRFPMNFASCKGKYGLCEKFPVCSTGKIHKQLFTVG